MRLGLHDDVLTKCCYDVAGAGGGRILMGRNGGFDVVHSSGEVDRGIDTSGTGNIVSIQLYEYHIYTLCKAPVPGTKRHVIVFDSHYNQLNRWPVPDYGFISSIAVVSSRVFVADPDNKQVVVYTTDGTPLPPIKHSTFNKPVHLSICPPHHLLVSDCGSNSVYKVDLRGDGKTEYVFTWISTVVNNPKGICWYNGEVWVSSRGSKTIQVLTDTGELKVKLEHPRLYEVPDDDAITGMYIRDNVLWAAAMGDGPIKFPIKH